VCSLLLIINLEGIIVSQKYWATSMLTKEIPIEIRKITGGMMDCKRNTFLNEGLILDSIDLVLTATTQIKANADPVKIRIMV
jgi:hypothetical protein